jgi:hypothetical protein
MPTKIMERGFFSEEALQQSESIKRETASAVCFLVGCSKAADALAKVI